MNPQFETILRLIPGKYFVINTEKEIESTSAEFKKKIRGIPCHKAIFNGNSTCHYCSFFNQDNPEILSMRSDLSREIQIKLPAAQGDLEDITLSQTILKLDDKILVIDIIRESPLPARNEASDQLTTLGAHVQTMAHELSNPLTGLNLTYQKMENMLNHAETANLGDLIPLMELFRKDILRASEIVSEIRNYSRPVSIHYKLIDLKQVLKSAIENVIRVSGRKDVILNFNWNLNRGSYFRGNPTKLEQCFINIVKNSFDMFNIRKNIIHPEITINVFSLKSENSAVIQIIDNAGGISKSALKNVFTPYFTTKEKFRGLGLGLYIAGRILKEHHSTISIESIEDKTSVTIKIPNQSAR